MVTLLNSTSTEAWLSGLCGVGMQARCCPCLVNSMNAGLTPFTRDGINLEEESGSERESEPHEGDHSATIDHSMGSGRHHFGSLLGSCLSPPLALANSKNKTVASCTARRDRWVGQSESAKYLRHQRSRTLAKQFGFAEKPNTYLARYSLIAFVSCFGIDSTKASMG